MSTKKAPTIAILTAGGMAPCLSACVGALIQRYTKQSPESRIICYRYGYQGLLLGDKVEVDAEVREKAHLLLKRGGSPICNSRVKLSDAKGCSKRGLVKEGEDPRAVAAAQLEKDGVDVLHTIGGDDTNTAAADLAAYLAAQGRSLTVVGLPKTIDNDIFPVSQTLGAWTAAEQAARFFANVVTEVTTAPRVLLVHEIMGRSSGYLAAAAARAYCRLHESEKDEWLPGIGLKPERFAIHAVYIPELAFDVEAESKRLREVMDKTGNVNVFLGESAGLDAVVADLKARGEPVPTDAFGHVWIDKLNAGQWFASRFAQLVGAEKVLVQKSGYFSRSAAPNEEDLDLILRCADKAVESALKREPGLVGLDQENNDELTTISFDRIKGAKPFEPRAEKNSWFPEMLEKIGQPLGKPAVAFHQ